MFLFSAVAVAAAVVVRVEVLVSERFRQSMDAFYAAQAGLDVAISELRQLESWAVVTHGDQTSRFTQGAFLGEKSVPGGGSVTLCCGAGSIFDRLAVASRTSPAPSRRALVWRPFLWTPFSAIAPRLPPSRLYLAVFVADDEEDVMAGSGAETNGLVLVRAEAVDPAGLHRTVEALITRSSLSQSPGANEDEAAPAPEPEARPPMVGIVSWREVRQ